MTKHVPLESMAKSVDRNVSAKTGVNVIHKVACVIVHLVGRVMFVLIAVNLDILVLNVKIIVNVITVAIVIMLPVNVNVVRDLLARNAWTLVRATHSGSIAARLAVARIKRNVINPTVIVRVRKAGLVSIVLREIVPTICMDLTVKKLVNVMVTTRICVIHGPVNVIARLDGVAVFVTDRARS